MSNVPGQQHNWHQPAPYIPGMMAMSNSPEMGQLMGLFAGQVLGPMFGPQNFLPHLTPGVGVMDQYAMRHFQQQQMLSANAIGTANNSNVAARILALRTGFTNTAPSEQNRNQAENIASIINNPLMKVIAGQLVGPETLEAMLHGTKGDVSQLHSATMRMGYFRRNPSGAQRMDARAMEDFSRGVYAHLYEEGGNFETLAAQAESADENTRRASRARLKKAARVADDTEILTESDFVGRVKTDDPAIVEKIASAYKKYAQGEETDTMRQAEAIAKIAPAVKETGLLTDREMLLPQLKREAEKMQVAEMHGLMAGQVGRLAEYMTHRGMLPQAIGAMSAADRVKLMGGQIDDDTVARLAMQEAKRDLFESSEEYRNAGAPRQAEMESERAKEHKTRIRNTSTAIQQFNETGAGSIEDLEKMGGFEAIASNVDSQRTASALKKYSGAVDAIREIFGDNGNPNAPMPALLAALDHLTQGANFQMDAKDVEATLRQMQMTAKEAGIGFEQMSGMAAEMGAMGQMLGLSPTAVMHGQVNAMAMIKTMRDTGAFSTPRFGAMGQGEAQQIVAQKMIAGDASDNAKAMAAAASIYQTGRESFAGSEFAAAMEAYIGGNNTYTDPATGKTVNLFETVGREGPSAITRLFTAAGGTQQELMTAFRSPLAQEFLRSGAGMQTQKYEAIRDINRFGMGGLLANNFERFGRANAGSAIAGQNTGQLGSVAGTAITNMLVETAQMSTADQISFVERELPAQLKETFKTQLGLDDAQAEKLANETFAAAVGTVDPNANEEDRKKQKAEQNRRILQLRSQADSVISGLSGGQLNLVKFAEIFAGNRVEQTIATTQQTRRAAERRAEAGLGYKSHPLARASDLLLEAGMTGEQLSIGRLLGEVMNIVPSQELATRYTHGMEGGINAVNERLKEITYTDDYLKNLTVGTEAADKELLALAERAGINTEKLAFEDAGKYDERGKKAAELILGSNNDDAIRQAYLAASGERSTGLTTDKMLSELRGSGKIAARFRDQQSENAFYREQARSSKSLSDAEISMTYAKHFGEGAAEAAIAAGKDKNQLREELIASDWGVKTGKILVDSGGGPITRQKLIRQLADSKKVIGTLRDDARVAGGTEEEVTFLNRFNAGVMGAANEDIRRDLISQFTAAYKMSDTNIEDDVSKEDELEALIRNTDPDDKDAQKKLADQVRTMMTIGGGQVDDKAIGRAQAAAETMRVSAGINPQGAGVQQIGDINTKDTTINASGGTIVIQGATVQQQPPGRTPATAPAPTAAAATAAATTPTTSAASGTVAAAQDAAPTQDKPLPPVATPTGTPTAAEGAKARAATEQAEQTYGPGTASSPETGFTRKPDAARMEMLDSLSASAKRIKQLEEAGDTHAYEIELEKFGTNMRGAMSERLLPALRDEFGDVMNNHIKFGPTAYDDDELLDAFNRLPPIPSTPATTSGPALSTEGGADTAFNTRLEEIRAGIASNDFTTLSQSIADSGIPLSADLLTRAGKSAEEAERIMAGANEPASAALPPQSGATSANITPNAAGAATNAAQQTVKQNSPAPAPAGGGGQTEPLKIEGELSIVNLTKAIFTALSSSGSVTPTAGDGMPIMSAPS
jgi:hypothetical protein